MYSEIIVLNNRGSLLLNAGNLKGATASFSSALQAIKKTTPFPSSRMYTMEGEDTVRAQPLGVVVRLAPKIECCFSNRQQQGHGRLDHQCQSSFSINCRRYRPGVVPSSGGGNFIHDQPIELYYQYPHDVDEQCDAEPQHREQEPEGMTTMIAEHRVFQIVTFCVVYNLALSSHLQAMDVIMKAEDDQQRRRGQDQNEQLLSTTPEEAMKLQTTLQQAAQLYAHAHILLTKCSAREDYCILHDLAIFNNHGHVLYKLGRVLAEGRRNFQVVFQSITRRQIMMVAGDGSNGASWSARPSPCRSHVYTEDHQIELVDGLLSNVLYYLMGSCKNAAAA